MDVGQLITKFQTILSAALPLLVSLGVLYFIWGIVQYFIGDSEEAKKTGRDRIIYGIVGLAIIISIWGLVDIIVKTFNLTSTTPIVSGLVPQGSGSGSGCTAPSNTSTNKLSDYLNYFTTCIGASVIPFIFSIAVLTFIWGVVKFFIINADEEAKRQEGKQFMLWGVIALAVMISVWGLVNILGKTFNLNTSVLPTVQPSSTP